MTNTSNETESRKIAKTNKKLLNSGRLEVCQLYTIKAMKQNMMALGM